MFEGAFLFYDLLIKCRMKNSGYAAKSKFVFGKFRSTEVQEFRQMQKIIRFFITDYSLPEPCFTVTSCLHALYREGRKTLYINARTVEQPAFTASRCHATTYTPVKV